MHVSTETCTQFEPCRDTRSDYYYGLRLDENYIVSWQSDDRGSLDR
jgi:hypothetical protein